MKKTANILDLLPYLQMEEGAYVMKDGRVFVGYEVLGFEYELLGKDELGVLAQTINKVVNDLPNNANLQKVDIYMEEAASGFELLDYKEGYITEEIKKFVGNRKRFYKKSYLFIELMPDKYSAPDGLRSYFTNQLIPKDSMKGYERRTQLVKEIGREVARQLERYSEFRKMEEGEIELLMWRMINLDMKGTPSGLEGSIDNTQVGGLMIGSKVLSVISYAEQGVFAQEYSEKEYVSKVNVAEPFIAPVGFDLQFPHVTVTNLRKLEKEVGLAQFSKELMFNKNLPDTPVFRKARQRAEVVQQICDSVNAGQDCLAEVSLTVLVWSEGVLKEEQVEKVKASIKEIEGAKVIVESYDAGPLFWSCLPGNGSQNYRRLMMTSSFASIYFDFTREYGSDKQGDFFCDRFGNFLQVDSFHPSLVAQNTIVVGPTGSGKSFSQGSLIGQAVQRGEIIIIIDKGGTYKQLITSVKGAYYEHTEQNPLRFNPFACPRDSNGNYIVSTDKVLTLRTLISILWKSKRKNEVFSNAESSVVMALIPEYYDNCSLTGKIATLGGFCKWVEHIFAERKDDHEFGKKMGFFDVDHFSVVMDPYVNGMYKEILNAEDALDLAEHRILCFDLEGIQKDPVMFPIVAMLLIDVVMEHIRKFPNVRKRIYFDEAWSFLVGEMEEFIEYMFRTVRKNNGNITIITQTAMDIKNSEVSSALIGNTMIYVILNHRGQDVRPLKEVFSFEDHDIEKVQSLRLSWPMERCGNAPGGRELFIKRIGVDARVYALEVAPAIYPLLTSMPAERNHFRKLLEHHPLERAVHEFMLDKASKVI